MTALEGFVLGIAAAFGAFMLREMLRTRGSRIAALEAQVSDLRNQVGALAFDSTGALANITTQSAIAHALDRDIEQIYARTPGLTRYGKAHKT